jgi:hypothetical protein
MTLRKNVERAQLAGFYGAGVLGAAYGGLVGLKFGAWLLGINERTGLPTWRNR